MTWKPVHYNRPIKSQGELAVIGSAGNQKSYCYCNEYLVVFKLQKQPEAISLTFRPDVNKYNLKMGHRIARLAQSDRASDSYHVGI
jgi:hypothetical protein